MLLKDLRIIVKVAELGSITAAAKHFDLQTATASAALKRVEQSLGAELFVRSTRRLRISTAGEKFLPLCKQSLETFDRAKFNIQNESASLDGELRLALSSDFGRNIVRPWLDEFMQHHPEVSVSINISDSVIDFYREPIDLALRYGKPSDGNLYGFKICQVPGVLCASPDYLARYGEPQHPEDLSQHNGLFFHIQGTPHNQWEFWRGQEHFKIQMKGKHSTNDGDLVRRWCVAGQGLAYKSLMDMSADIAAKKVKVLLTEYRTLESELWMVFPTRQSITPAARVFRDYLKTKTQSLLSQVQQQ